MSDSNDAPVSLRSGCHPQAPFFLFRWENTGRLKLCCVELGCQRAVMRAAGGRLADADGEFRRMAMTNLTIWRQGCHPDGTVWAFYRPGSGAVEVTCRECGRHVLTICVE